MGCHQPWIYPPFKNIPTTMRTQFALPEPEQTTIERLQADVDRLYGIVEALGSPTPRLLSHPSQPTIIDEADVNFSSESVSAKEARTYTKKKVSGE